MLIFLKELEKEDKVHKKFLKGLLSLLLFCIGVIHLDVVVVVVVAFFFLFFSSLSFAGLSNDELVAMVENLGRHLVNAKRPVLPKIDTSATLDKGYYYCCCCCC